MIFSCRFFSPTRLSGRFDTPTSKTNLFHLSRSDRLRFEGTRGVNSVVNPESSLKGRVPFRAPDRFPTAPPRIDIIPAGSL